MQPIRSILVVVDRSAAAADAVAKAVLLARRFHARIQLFICDEEKGYALSQAYVSTGVDEARHACLADAHRYLEALKNAANASDVDITVDAACESPLYESIVRKVMRDHPDLVVKNAAHSTGRRAVTFDNTDWQLMRACPATLVLTRGRPWAGKPKFAAAIDVSASESAGLAGAILSAAHSLAGAAEAQLDVVYAEPDGLCASDRENGLRSLRELVEHIPESGRQVHVLAGSPETTLPGFAAHRGYDALLLGALTHRPGITDHVGTLTSRLVGCLDADFILVKSDSYRSPVGQTYARTPASASSRC